MNNMQLLKEVCDVTLVSEDNERIRAHKVVLTPVSTPSGTVLWWQKYILWNYAYQRLIWCTMQNLRWIKDILKISWKSKEVQDFTTGKTNKIRCSFTIKASVRLALADCLTILICTLRLIWGGNPVGTLVTQNDL